MKDFAEKLYKSKAWQHTRRSYLDSVGGLCERCLKRGIYKPAVIVHHKDYLTPENIGNPEIAFSFSNLEALCRSCHEDEHSGDMRRFKVDEMGRVTCK